MRFLDKIVFINSAHVPYAEIELDGNVHFIGTQGVGKSATLRAILFFYNADKTRLGINKEQKQFDDFYLPNPDSYIIYEVSRENGRFFVMVFKSKGRAAYRIVDCPYDKRFFIEADGRVRHEWGKISMEIGFNVAKSNVIRNYGDFKNIIYGNTQTVDKDLRRYSIMESAKFQNVPRTIQNIFLNQSLESRVIKDTIIASMDFESDSFELAVWRNETKKFRNEYEDVSKWYRKEKNGRIKVVDDAARVESSHATYAGNKQQIVRLAGELLYAVKRDTELLPIVRNQKAETSTEKERQQRLLDEEKKKYDNEFTSLTKKIGELDKTLNDTKKRHDYWEQIDIKRILKLQKDKPSMELSLATLKKKYDTLMGSNTDIQEKYDCLKQNEKKKLDELFVELDKQTLQLQRELIEKKGQAMVALGDALRLLNADMDAEEKTLADKWQAEHEQKKNLELQLQKIATYNPNAERIEACNSKINSLTKRQHELEVNIEKLKSDENNIITTTEAKVRERQLEDNNASAEHERKMNDLDSKRNAIMSLLERQEGSLIQWLNSNVSNWEAGLGKVLDEDLVLYNTELSPELTDADANSLMGVRLDVSRIERTVRTPEQLNKELTDIENSIIAEKTKRQKQQLQLTADIEDIKKKPSTELRKLREQRTEAEAEASAIVSQTEKQMAEIHALNDATDKWRGQERQRISASLDEATVKLNDINVQRNELSKRRQTKEKALERDYKSQVAEMEMLSKRALDNILSSKTAFVEDTDKQLIMLDEQMTRELQGCGVDAQVLQTLLNDMDAINAQLAFLREHQQDYYDWQRDKRDLFDHEEENKSELKNVKKKNKELKAHFEAREKKLNATINKLSEKITSLSSRQEIMAEGLKDANAFWAANQEELPAADSLKEQNTPDELPQILSDLKETIYCRHRIYEDFKRSVDVFAANFSQNNTFSFPTKLASEADYVDYALELKEFVIMRKMDEQRKRTSDFYTHVLHRVAATMRDLRSHNSQVQKIINDINRDFQENNFVGVIKDIQLRIQQSNDPLTALAFKITDFVDESDLNMGELTLFSDNEQREANNIKAVRFLNALITQMEAEPKREYITLADTFKLEFKVKENDNDTSWVEKLSNVGSDGTDILVKAMVNIMLINVFKRKESKKFGDFRIHCMMDEIGKLHPNNVRGILEFANKRNIWLINSSPTTYNASEYRHTYTLSKDTNNNTIVRTLLTVR